jgi:hypothetical protein
VPSTNYITSYPYNNLPNVYRSTNGILGSYSVITGSGSGIASTSRIDWVTPYTLSPTNPSTLFLGTYQMYRSTNNGTSWSFVGPTDMTGGGSENISTVSVCRTNGNYVYAGTTDGYVWRSTDGGTTWSQLSGGLPARRINDVEADPTNPGRAFCVVSGFGTAHLYEYAQGTWIARGGGLPDVPANTVLVLSANLVYVGTDVGVFVSSDGGVSFNPFNYGLPAGLVITDLEFNSTTGTITAGTYGRGAWQYTFVCTALDQCHTAGVFDPGTGACTNPAKADGTACDDGSLCTRTDTCQSGICTGADPVTCTALDPCHDAGVCDTGTGLCPNPAKPNGATCSDGNACTAADACSGGACVGGPATVCDDGNPCTDDNCDSATGCVYTNNTAPCDDGNACTTNDTCQFGTCVPGSPVGSPSEVSNLRLDPDRSTLTWDAIPEGVVGAVYDVARGLASQPPVGGGAAETCVASGADAPTASDPASPPEGDAFWYVVRGRHACGTGTYGYASQAGSPATERAASACP